MSGVKDWERPGYDHYATQPGSRFCSHGEPRGECDAWEKRNVKSFVQMQKEVREVNELNGWFEEDRPFGDGIALLHTEVSEAYEAFRRWGLADATNDVRPRGEDGELVGPQPKPEGVGSEYADVLIRLLDSCDRDGIDLQAEYDRKLAHNRLRGYRHGGKSV